MYTELYKMHYGAYKFVTEIDTGAEVGANQVTVWFQEKGHGNELHFLRTFYFEEANDDNIHTFCREFALYPDYRREILAGKRHWARRNALFVRNLYSVLGESVLLADDTSFEREARAFFRWLDIHTEKIEALPAYQQLLRLDSAFPHSIVTPEPLIQHAVTLLQQIPGVVTRFSCQGVSGKIHFQGYDLLAVSSHTEFAYVSFEKLSYFAHDALILRLPDFPHITAARIPCNFSSQLLLRSTGDNKRFQAELMTMAQTILATIQENGAAIPLEPGVTRWETVSYPERQPQITAPGGLLPSRLAWLCQPKQIERTLCLLFHLNHWAKASTQLFYIDRQGLYKVKAALIQQAYASHFLQPITYIDGIATFARDFTIEMATDIAAEFLLERLALLSEKERRTSSASKDEYDRAARQLFTRISGRAMGSSDDHNAPSKTQAERYIRATLYALIEQARRTRQPIPYSELAALLIGPNDLLALPYNREHLIEFWHELDETNARKLDPEGSSLIAFQYTNAGTSYIFHLPFRVAERFLPNEHIQRLKQYAGHSRELGLHYGLAITEEESRAYPVTEILYELAVNVSSICPRQLASKKEFYAFAKEDESQSYGDKGNEHSELREAEGEYETRASGSGKLGRSKRARRRKYRAQQHLWPTCPLCKGTVAGTVSAHITHWCELHSGQDLTISQVTWVLRQRTIGRPTLMHAIDAYSGFICGLYVGFEPPSYLAVQNCLLHSILPKPDCQEIYGTKHSWPVYGLPETLIVDNGKHYICNHLENACGQLGINVHEMPIRTPWFKGRIERFFRTNNTGPIHSLPGTTFSNIIECGDYDPQKSACISLTAFMELLHVFLLDKYSQEWHDGIGESGGVPAKLWEESLQSGFVPCLHEDARELRFILYPGEYRTIQRSGIDFEVLRYQHPSLASIRSRLEKQKNRSKGEKDDQGNKKSKENLVHVKYNSADLGMIYVYDDEKHTWLEIPAVDPEYAKGLSIWKHRIIRKYILQKKKKEVNIYELAATKQHMQEIVEREYALTRKSRGRKRGARFLGIDSAITPTVSSENSQVTASEVKESEGVKVSDVQEDSFSESMKAVPSANDSTNPSIQKEGKARKKRGKKNTPQTNESTSPSQITFQQDLSEEGWGGDYGLPL